MPSKPTVTSCDPIGAPATALPLQIVVPEAIVHDRALNTGSGPVGGTNPLGCAAISMAVMPVPNDG